MKKYCGLKKRSTSSMATSNAYNNSYTLTNVRDMMLPMVYVRLGEGPEGLIVDLNVDHDSLCIITKYDKQIFIGILLTRKEMDDNMAVHLVGPRLDEAIAAVLPPKNAFVDEYEEILAGQEIMDEISQ